MDLLIHAYLIMNLDYELELVQKIVVIEVNVFLEISVAHQPSYHGLLVYLLFMGYLLQELRVLLDLSCGFKLYEALWLHYD